METNEKTPVANAPQFDPKTERMRYYSIRAAGAVWVIFLASYAYLLHHWITS